MAHTLHVRYWSRNGDFAGRNLSAAPCFLENGASWNGRVDEIQGTQLLPSQIVSGKWRRSETQLKLKIQLHTRYTWCMNNRTNLFRLYHIHIISRCSVHTFCASRKTWFKRALGLTLTQSTTVLIKAPAKRSQHANATYPNIVGRNMLRVFGHRVAMRCDVLRRVGCCWLKFDHFQIWANNTQHVATHRNTVAKRTQHVAPNNVGLCYVGMLRSFGRGLKQNFATVTKSSLMNLYLNQEHQDIIISLSRTCNVFQLKKLAVICRKLCWNQTLNIYL